MCVVISGQRQGQVYLCNSANLGPSAHNRHSDSEGCPGNFPPQKLDKLHYPQCVQTFDTEWKKPIVFPVCASKPMKVI